MAAAADFTPNVVTGHAPHLRSLPALHQPALHRGTRAAAAGRGEQERVRRTLAEALRARAASPPLQ